MFVAWTLPSGDLSGAAVAMDTCSASWVATPSSAAPTTAWDTPPASTGGAVLEVCWANFDNQSQPQQERSARDGEEGAEAAGWASFETPAAADTSGNSSVEGGNLSGGAGNWADFSTLDAAGGEGFGSARLDVENKSRTGRLVEYMGTL